MRTKNLHKWEAPKKTGIQYEQLDPELHCGFMRSTSNPRCGCQTRLTPASGTASSELMGQDAHDRPWNFYCELWNYPTRVQLMRARKDTSFLVA
jgi:hypothetical protein